MPGRVCWVLSALQNRGCWGPRGDERQTRSQLGRRLWSGGGDSEQRGQGRGGLGGIQNPGEAERGFEKPIPHMGAGRKELLKAEVRRPLPGLNTFILKMDSKLFTQPKTWFCPLSPTSNMLFPAPGPLPRLFHCLEIVPPCPEHSLKALLKCHLLQKAFLDHPRGSL